MSTDEMALTLVHDNEAERLRFDNLDMPEPDRNQAVLGGWRVAEQRSVPVLMQGRYGLTDADIEKQICFSCGDDLRSLQNDHSIDANMRYAYGVGFKSRMRLAKVEFLAGLAVVTKATEALEKIAEGLNAATGALNLAHGLVQPARCTPLPGLGSPLRRPLRPEDFGAFPLPPA